MLAFVLALILGDLGGSEADAGWIRAITQLGPVAGFLLAGEADRIGRKRLLPITIVGYTATTALTAVSPGLIWLTVAQFGAQGFWARSGRSRSRSSSRSSPENIVAGARDRHLDEHPRGHLRRGARVRGPAGPRARWRSFFLVGLIPRNEERAGAMAGPSYEARSVARARGVGDQLPSPRGMGYVLALYPSHRAKRARCTRDLEKVRLVAVRALPATLALPAGAVAAI